MGEGDRLVLEGMQFFGHHGELAAERELGSRVFVDVELYADLARAGESDSLTETIDYVRCHALVREVVEQRQFNLIEAIAENVARALLQELPATSVRVRVAKEPPIDGVISRTAVVIERGRRGAVA